MVENLHTYELIVIAIPELDDQAITALNERIANWVKAGSGDSLNAALSEVVQLDGTVQTRVESDSDDHVRTTVGPASSISSAISWSSPMSLITVSIASRSQT